MDGEKTQTANHLTFEVEDDNRIGQLIVDILETIRTRGIHLIRHSITTEEIISELKVKE